MAANLLSKGGSRDEGKPPEGVVKDVSNRPEPTRNHRVAPDSRAPEVRKSV